MNNYFDNEIKQLEKEILNLKTSAQKSAGVVPTTAKTINVTVNLALRSTFVCSGTANYLIRTNSNALVIVTLDKYYDDVYRAADYPYTTRESYWVLGSYRDGSMSLLLTCFGTANDAQTIEQGGSVSMTVNITVRCTSDFTIERA